MPEKDVVAEAFEVTNARITQNQEWVDKIERRLTQAEKRIATQGETIKKLEDRMR